MQVRFARDWLMLQRAHLLEWTDWVDWTERRSDQVGQLCYVLASGESSRS